MCSVVEREGGVLSRESCSMREGVPVAGSQEKPGRPKMLFGKADTYGMICF